jgi:hypothetical protein
MGPIPEGFPLVIFQTGRPLQESRVRNSRKKIKSPNFLIPKHIPHTLKKNIKKNQAKRLQVQKKVVPLHRN